MGPGTPPSPRRETLFRQEAPGGVTYRIPALLYLPPAATFLAFAEKRSSARDEDAQHLVLRRGRRRGLEWGPAEELPQLTLPGHRTMSPCPVYEAAGGTVFLFCICVRGRVTERRQVLAGRNAARLCCAASPDGGRSWAPLRDLTEPAVGPELRRWATFAVGPGHGVQLAAGRLAVPAYAYYVHRRFCGLPLPCCTEPHALVFYSDDRGRSWRRGALVEGLRTGECQVAEIAAADGGPVLYCSARTPRRCRAVALSTDRGLRFGRSAPCEQLCEPPRGCQGSVVSFAGPPGAGQPLTAASWLLFSHPTDKRRRRDLGLYVNPSPLEREGWRRPWVLHEGPCGYSDLAVCPDPDGLFGCLFECGAASGCEEIAFCLFTRRQLLSACGAPAGEPGAA
ncbi:sialidase-3 isoform X2 [Dromaius novaehollandiae]|uniref:sialidase-3 isoform X2 n=1 Tax=Dromaius novaehollandiae TaxID=8790 RepID=UPI00311DA761